MESRHTELEPFFHVVGSPGSLLDGGAPASPWTPRQ
jgi:hypothetical protein